MRIVMRNALMVGFQLIAVAGCGSSEAPASSAVPSSQPASQGTGAGAAVAQDSDGVWTVREEVDPLTDKRKTIGTISFRSQEQGRYQFELILDEEPDLATGYVRAVHLNQGQGVTVRVTILDGEPTGLQFQTFRTNKMWATKPGRYRVDDASATTIQWLQSDEFANVFSTIIPFGDLLTVERRLLLTGLRSVDEVFELPRNRSSDALWRTIEQRVAESRLAAVQSAESTAFARKPGRGAPITEPITRQSLTGLGSIRSGMSKVDVYLAMGSQGPVMATDGAIAEWHYCSTGQEGADDQLATVFFVDGRVVDLARYRAGTPGDCTENLKSGDYAEPAAVTALRSKQ